MINLRLLAIRKLCEIKAGEIQNELRATYHNGTIRNWPNIDDAEEYDLFNNCFSDYVSNEIEYLQDWIKEDFGLDWQIYQWGRSGATFATEIF